MAPISLAVVTARLNARIRNRGLSARELLMQRDQFNNQQIPVSDLTKILEQHKHRIVNHPHSERSKVPGMNVLPSTEVAVGDLVYIHAYRNKSKARHRYLVVPVESACCNIRKLFGSHLRNTSYRVKRYECYKMPNDYRDMTPYPHRSFDAESLSDCDDTHGQAQYQDVEFPEPPPVPVELSTLAQRLDESHNASVEDAISASGIQDAECADEVPEASRRSQRKPRKPKWFAGYETN